MATVLSRTDASNETQWEGEKAITRRQIGDGFIVSVKRQSVPLQSAPDGTRYRRFGFGVVGGHINMHLLHGCNHRTEGKRVWVRAEIWEKTHEDTGAQYLYVDLKPISAETVLTHEYKIYQRSEDIPSVLPDGAVKFDCRGDIKGALVFIPRK